MDWLFSEHAGEIVRRRSGRPPFKRAMRRLEAARMRDPYAAWKRAARVWLDELRRSEAFPDQR